jgi:hypothetical protein
MEGLDEKDQTRLSGPTIRKLPGSGRPCSSSTATDHMSVPPSRSARRSMSVPGRESATAAAASAESITGADWRAGTLLASHPGAPDRQIWRSRPGTAPDQVTRSQVSWGRTIAARLGHRRRKLSGATVDRPSGPREVASVRTSHVCRTCRRHRSSIRRPALSAVSSTHRSSSARDTGSGAAHPYDQPDQGRQTQRHPTVRARCGRCPGERLRLGHGTAIRRRSPTSPDATRSWQLAFGRDARRRRRRGRTSW